MHDDLCEGLQIVFTIASHEPSHASASIIVVPLREIRIDVYLPIVQLVPLKPVFICKLNILEGKVSSKCFKIASLNSVDFNSGYNE